MSVDRRTFLMTLGAGVATSGLLRACAGGGGASAQATRGERVQTVGRAGFPSVGFADWTDSEPEYVLYPGDEIEVATPTAPELTRTQRIGPDGRVSLPLVGQIMAADRTIAELEADAATGYASQLRRPLVEVTLKTAGPINVWVDGEVKSPGVFAMPGDIDAYQAIIMAGGFLPTARQSEVALIRRGPGGSRMLRAADLRPRQGEVIALRRGDILFVPRSTLGEVANFVTQFRNALPVGFTYALGGQYQQF